MWASRILPASSPTGVEGPTVTGSGVMYYVADLPGGMHTLGRRATFVDAAGSFALFGPNHKVVGGKNADAAPVFIHHRCAADAELGQNVSRALQGHVPRDGGHVLAHQIRRRQGEERLFCCRNHRSPPAMRTRCGPTSAPCFANVVPPFRRAATGRKGSPAGEPFCSPELR